MYFCGENEMKSCENIRNNWCLVVSLFVLFPFSMFLLWQTIVFFYIHSNGQRKLFFFIIIIIEWMIIFVWISLVVDSLGLQWYFDPEHSRAAHTRAVYIVSRYIWQSTAQLLYHMNYVNVMFRVVLNSYSRCWTCSR